MFGTALEEDFNQQGSSEGSETHQRVKFLASSYYSNVFRRVRVSVSCCRHTKGVAMKSCYDGQIRCPEVQRFCSICSAFGAPLYIDEDC